VTQPRNQHGGGGGQTARLPRIDVGLLFAALMALVLVAVPMWLVLVNSWKSTGEALKASLDLPVDLQVVENYLTVLGTGFAQGLQNSLIVLVATLIMTLTFSAMASWVFARRSSDRSVRLAQILCLIGLLVPVAIVPLLRLLSILELYGGHVGLVLTYVALFVPVGVLLFTGFVAAIPRDLEDAARIDGAGRQRVFWSVIFPLLRPVAFTGGFLMAVAIWNDFFFAYLILASGDAFTLPLGLFNYVSASQYQVRWELVFSYIVLTNLPVLILYAFVHRAVVGGVTAAGDGR
jgi:raffinose/stachyose/melibiose transport system permease protein